MNTRINIILAREFPKQLTDSLSLFRNFQTYRTAKELSSTVMDTFRQYDLPMQKSRFFGKVDFAQIHIPSKTVELMILRKREHSIFGITEIDWTKIQETPTHILINCRQAYSLQEEENLVREGKLSPYEDLPISIQMDNEVKLFRKGDYESPKYRLRLS